MHAARGLSHSSAYDDGSPQDKAAPEEEEKEEAELEEAEEASGQVSMWGRGCTKS